MGTVTVHRRNDAAEITLTARAASFGLPFPPGIFGESQEHGASAREVLVLGDIQHLSIKDTAVALGVSEANVKVRLLRARLQMRDALAPGIDGSWTCGKIGIRESKAFLAV